ncbi:hypothetical protein ACSBR2_012233 [Camellia fascicularis]
MIHSPTSWELFETCRFHGHIGTFKTKGKHPFPKLRTINISYNEFTRFLTTNYIKQFEAMMNVDEHEMKLKYTGETYYQYSVVVVMKRLEIEYLRILTWDEFLKGANLIHLGMIHTMGTWPYVHSRYQRYVRNNNRCYLHQRSNMMKIQIGRVNLTGKLL